MRAALVIACKDLRLLLRDRAALFWVVGFPLVFALFFGSVMKADSESDTAAIAVIVVDAPTDSAQRAADTEALAKFLEQAGLQVSRAAAATAHQAVRRGDSIGFVEAGEDGVVALGIDPSRRSEAALLQALLRSASSAAPPSTVRVTNVARSGVARSGYEVVFPAMVLWGLLGCAAAFAISMVGERSTGSFLRLRAAPLTRIAILAGKALACAAACAATASLLSLVGWLALDVQIAAAGRFVAVVGAIVVCFSGLTMMLSVLGTTEQSVAGAGWATLILMAMLGGAMVPLALFPDWLLAASNFSPVRWGILALEGATWRDFDWSELVQPLAILSGVGVVTFLAGVGVLAAQREV
ncbi:MAG TPA: ABC transporter permease [Terriglobales bacterium]|nr:ABC transporter permease [Terriglobales bacterium]